MKQTNLPPEDAELVNFMSQIGWAPDRRCDIKDDLDEWALGNYTASAVIKEFMKHCSGLTFEYPRHPAVGGLHSCVISGALATRRIPRQLVTDYENRTGVPLCPIGQSDSGNMFLMMDSSGVTYGGHESFLARIADDGYHALLAIWKKNPVFPLP